MGLTVNEKANRWWWEHSWCHILNFQSSKNMVRIFVSVIPHKGWGGGDEVKIPWAVRAWSAPIWKAMRYCPCSKPSWIWRSAVCVLWLERLTVNGLRTLWDLENRHWCDRSCRFKSPLHSWQVWVEVVKLSYLYPGRRKGRGAMRGEERESKWRATWWWLESLPSYVGFDDRLDLRIICGYSIDCIPLQRRINSRSIMITYSILHTMMIDLFRLLLIRQSWGLVSVPSCRVSERHERFFWLERFKSLMIIFSKHKVPKTASTIVRHVLKDELIFLQSFSLSISTFFYTSILWDMYVYEIKIFHQFLSIVRYLDR